MKFLDWLSLSLSPNIRRVQTSVNETVYMSSNLTQNVANFFDHSPLKFNQIFLHKSQHVQHIFELCCKKILTAR